MDESMWREFITPQMGAVAFGVVAVMFFIGHIPLDGGKRRLRESCFWKSWGLFIMFGLSVAGAFMPGIHDIAYSEWGSIVVFGSTTAIAALLLRGILKPLLLNKLEGKEPNKE